MSAVDQLPDEDFFLTGSTCFYGSGNDIDYVVRNTPSNAEILGFVEVDLNGHAFIDSIYPGFISCRDGENNFIVVDDVEFDVWRQATKVFMDELSESETIRNDKGIRAAVFEALKRFYRKENTPPSLSLL